MIPRRRTVSTQPPLIEPLEERTLLSSVLPHPVPLATLSKAASATIPANINISRMRVNQTEGAVAIDPHDPNRVFALSNSDVAVGMFSAYSSDGGHTWTKRMIATGKDKLVSGFCDPSAIFDDSGNLFISYLSNTPVDSGEVALSTDGGKTFTKLASFKGDVDQPTLATGPGSVWITFSKGDHIMATGAAVQGLGQVGAFARLGAVPGSAGGNFGDISIGARGQVLVSFMAPVGDSGPSRIFVSLDRDGLGSGGFAAPIVATNTTVGGFKPIRAQRGNTIDAEPALAYDRSGKFGAGRVYLVYTTTTGTDSNDTDTYFRVSRDDGGHWGVAQRVNTDNTHNSQFLPRIAVDQSTGNVGISWYDSRNDNGTAPASTNKVANDDAQFWGVIAHPTAAGVAFSPNFQISKGTSNAGRADTSQAYGDYTGLSMAGGLMIPIWADNSNSTNDNPDGRLHELDMYVALIPIT